MGIPVIPVTETIKLVEGRWIKHTLDRKHLRRVQTPQGFRYGILKEALARARKDNFLGTDDAVLVERLGRPVEVVEGERTNLKITTPEDLKIAEVLFEL